MWSRMQGRLFILSAPSGTGKTTLARRLIERVPHLKLSRSYTTRPIRTGECDGVDYHFISAATFDEMVRAGAFLEWAEVFGARYGTGAAETRRVLASGDDLLLVIDVEGARQVRASGLPSVGIFVMPPSFEELERRLRNRSGDSEEQIQRRLAVARQEVLALPEYDYVVVNDQVDACVGRLSRLVQMVRAAQAPDGPPAA